MELPLVDVNSDTAPETWPLLRQAVQQAHFIALDLELSGLGSIIGQGSGLTIESRYDAVCETVKSRAILSIGVACFRWEDEQATEDPILRSPTSQPSPQPSTSSSHNLQYSPVKSSLPSEPDRLPISDASRGSSPSLLSSSSIGLGARTFNVWLMCQKPYTIDPVSAQFLLQHGFDFNKQFAKGIPYTPGPMQKLDSECVSLHSLLAAILASRKPVVVHNGWIDILFLYGNFYAPLPPSLATLTADLAEMFEGGIYDTKAIAQFEVAEEATFLEFLFRKCQSDNDGMMTRGSPHIHLNSPTLPPSVSTELVPLLPRHTPSLEEAVATSVCPTFARAGYCHTAQCPDSHDVLLVLAQHEHQLQIRQIKRKRKRENQKAKAARVQDDICPPPKQQRAETQSSLDLAELGDTELETSEDALQPSDPSDSNSVKISDLAEQFAHEFEAARSKFTAGTNDPGLSSSSTTPSVPSFSQEPCSSSANGTLSNSHFVSHTADSSSPVIPQKPSFGHRAGFDAFMTGYIFAYYAITQPKSKPSFHAKDLMVPTIDICHREPLTRDEAMIAGLSQMRHRLSNRNKPVPLILAKSQFAKTSQAHRENCSRIADFRKQLF